MKKNSIKAAAIQMTAELANPKQNYMHASNLIAEAFGQGAEIVLLPEMFSTAVAFNPSMMDAILMSSEESLKFLRSMAGKHRGIVGGSFLEYKEGDVYNAFHLVFPDGKRFVHRKDLPTMWENCYYVGGDDDGIIASPIGNIGIVLCWEMIRGQTIRRLKGKVDLVLASSCWWGTPVNMEQRPLDIANRKNLDQAPVVLSKMLGVPVIHASHAGLFEGYRPPDEKQLKKRQYLGETKIVDRDGRTVSSLKAEDGSGVLISELDLQSKGVPSLADTESYWTQELPEEILKAWHEQGEHGRKYYQEVTKKYLQKK